MLIREKKRVYGNKLSFKAQNFDLKSSENFTKKNLNENQNLPIFQQQKTTKVHCDNS